MLVSSSFSEPSFKTPVSHDDADQRAGGLLAQMTREEKLSLVTGHNSFYVRGLPRLGLPAFYMSDATQGVHIRKNLSNGLEKSTAFPCPLSLAATWNPALAYRYAHSVGEECRAGDVAFLLGPGMNIYRVAQCGRNFEYFGEDPFLAARMIERYVRGVLDTGTIPTVKHFVANNTDHHRRTSNSVVDERTLHEIYLPAFKAGIDAGAMAVMTAYNQFNGEWCGQNRALITDLLRGELGYKWMVMTDWWSVWDAAKIIHSGQDLEMPGEKFLVADADRLLQAGKVSMDQIERMARTILRTCIAAGLHDRPVKDTYYLQKFPDHEQVALQTAREGIVLLKNDGILPLPVAASASEPTPAAKILLTGLFVDNLARGGGSADVEGYNHVTLLDALRATYGDRIEFVPNPTDEQLTSAPTVLVSTGTFDSEGWDRPFALPADEEQRVVRAVSLNPRTVVIVNAGGGIRLTGWNDRAAAILYAWYPGQIGNRALAEILCGQTNPSGKLPITIEREFADSPAPDYLPPGEKLYTGWDPDNDMSHRVNQIVYREGIFVGYRWYEAKRLAPLYPFGHGLSYTTFSYQNASVSPTTVSPGNRVTIDFSLTNTGPVAGAEIAQVYVRALHPPVERPEKELKGFAKAFLAPGETKNVTVRLTTKDFAFWDVTTHAWNAAPGDYELLIGPASDRILLKTRVTLH
ncbi:MAG TPA: glycoside hydrolase family 3 N-terminal domain-containing protein [Opitutus sp.]|nr:glycoside hydrolase family 3 N-terminal domain-containing protein [Opitutus sp.]